MHWQDKPEFLVPLKVIWVVPLSALRWYHLKRYDGTASALWAIWEVEIQIISEFGVIKKLQYTRIYSNRNHRNKWWSSTQLSNDKVENNTSNSYLCGGNNKFNIVDHSKSTIKSTKKKGQIGITLIIKIIMTFIINVWGARGRWFESSHPDSNRKHR